MLWRGGGYCNKSRLLMKYATRCLLYVSHHWHQHVRVSLEFSCFFFDISRVMRHCNKRWCPTTIIPLLKPCCGIATAPKKCKQKVNEGRAVLKSGLPAWRMGGTSNRWLPPSKASVVQMYLSSNNNITRWCTVWGVVNNFKQKKWSSSCSSCLCVCCCSSELWPSSWTQHKKL